MGVNGNANSSEVLLQDGSSHEASTSGRWIDPPWEGAVEGGLSAAASKGVGPVSCACSNFQAKSTFSQNSLLQL